jgi:hypothetical protein
MRNTVLLRKPGTQILLRNTKNSGFMRNMRLPSVYQDEALSGEMRQMGTRCDK